MNFTIKTNYSGYNRDVIRISSRYSRDIYAQGLLQAGFRGEEMLIFEAGKVGDNLSYRSVKRTEILAGRRTSV